MAQKGVNKTIILGNLGKDPEVKYMPSGEAVANITVATSESWNDKSTGEKKEKTEWHRIVFFGKLAEIVGQYLKKGDKIYIEGRLQTRKWQKDGQDHYSTEIIVDQRGTMQMLGGTNTQQEAGNQQQGYREQAQSSGSVEQPNNDIPF